MEYTGEAVKSLNMEGRMTICNMSIEGGARAGMIAPDQTTYDWMKGRNKVPKGSDWEKAIKEWDELRSDPDAIYDSYVEVDCNDLEPFVSWGTNLLKYYLFLQKYHLLMIMMFLLNLNHVLIL